MIRNKQNMKSYLSSLFAFLLTLLLVILFVCAGIGLGVFNSRSVISNINNSSYYHGVYDNINQQVQEVLSTAGLPPDTLDEVITLERVYIANLNYIEAVLQGEDAQIKTEKLVKDMANTLDQYLQRNQIVPTQTMRSDISSMITLIENYYKDGIELQFVNYVSEYRGYYADLMKIVIPSLLLLISILCYLLIRMDQYMHRGIRYIAYALLSSSLITIGSACFLLIMKYHEKIEVSPNYYKEFIASFIKWDITILIYMGGIGIVFTLVLITLIGYLKNRMINY